MIISTTTKMEQRGDLVHTTIRPAHVDTHDDASKEGFRILVCLHIGRPCTGMGDAGKLSTTWFLLQVRNVGYIVIDLA